MQVLGRTAGKWICFIFKTSVSVLGQMSVLHNGNYYDIINYYGSAHPYYGTLLPEAPER